MASILQSSTPTELVAGATTIQDTVTGVVAGSTLLVHCGHEQAGGVSVSSVTDSNGSNHTLTDGPRSDATNAGESYVYRLENCAAGTHTITVNYSASVGYRRLRIIEVGGVETTSVLDRATGQHQSAPGTGTDAVTSGSTAATTNANDIVIALSNSWAATFNSLGGTITAGTGFTAISPAQREFAAAYKTVSATGAQAGTFTLSVDTAQTTHVIVLKDAGGGGSSFVPRSLLLGVG